MLPVLDWDAAIVDLARVDAGVILLLGYWVFSYDGFRRCDWLLFGRLDY